MCTLPGAWPVFRPFRSPAAGRIYYFLQPGSGSFLAGAPIDIGALECLTQDVDLFFALEVILAHCIAREAGSVRLEVDVGVYPLRVHEVVDVEDGAVGVGLELVGVGGVVVPTASR